MVGTLDEIHADVSLDDDSPAAARMVGPTGRIRFAPQAENPFRDTRDLAGANRGRI